MYDPTKPYKKQIIKAIKKTWNTPFVTVKSGVYPLIIKKFDFPEVDHTDGIGTKGFYHWRAGTFKNAVIDALAMNLNDLALVRSVPYKLQNHITLPIEDERILKIIFALAEESKKRKIAITGGENSFHENIDSLDISITVSGLVKEPKTNSFRVGDYLVGFRSSGLHANGFTKVNQLFGEEIRPEFLIPTKIYLEEILKINEKYEIHGMMNITGGAFSKLKDIAKKADVTIIKNHKLQPHSIFHEIYSRGLRDKDMYTTFNCGIGFILSASKSEAKKIVAEFNDTDIIGEVTKGTGSVHIESNFSNRTITL